ncbi:MAG: hypothetical protein KAI40_06335 [Desulfobacterales bacterium]|nr:hypothetical protein [Desulfobacterales bacterium]
MTQQHTGSNLKKQNTTIIMPDWNNDEYEKNASSLEITNKNQLKTTPLHEWHLASGANMANFGGYHMPLWYETGVKTDLMGEL